jgi:hypothetical protein
LFLLGLLLTGLTRNRVVQALDRRQSTDPIEPLPDPSGDEPGSMSLFGSLLPARAFVRSGGRRIT